MRKILLYTSFTIALLLLSACSLAATPADTSEPVQEMAVTAAPTNTQVTLPTLTSIPPTQTPAVIPSPTPYQPFEAVTGVENLLLREGPGFLVNSAGMYPQGTVVKVLGHAPGASWIYVETPEKHYGWMKLELLDMQGHSFYEAPEVIPGGFVIVKGHLYTPNGSPASDITLSLQPASSDTPADADAATTDVLGQFYFFLPPGSKGDWVLAANAYGCESNAVNTGCSLIGTFPPPITITLNPDADLWYNIEILP